MNEIIINIFKSIYEVMTPDQALVFGTLILALIFFVWGPWRYDMVALLALLALAITGIVPWDHAFTGFGHPAVVTVAAVLITSRGLHNSGIVEIIAGWLSRAGNSPASQRHRCPGGSSLDNVVLAFFLTIFSIGAASGCGANLNSRIKVCRGLTEKCFNELSPFIFMIYMSGISERGGKSSSHLHP